MERFLWIVMILMLIAALAMAGVVVYSCCHRAFRDPVEGKVIARQEHPEHTTMIMMPMKVGEMTTMIPMYFHYPPSWSIRVREGNGDIETVYLPKDKWDGIKVGDRFSEKKYGGSAERPRRKTTKEEYEKAKRS